MKKRLVLTTIILFPIYVLLVYLYLFHWTSAGVPEAYRGTAADPVTFMSAQEIALSQEYSRYRNLLYFIGLPFEILIYIAVLVFGWSPIFKSFGERVSRFSFINIPIFVLLLSTVVWVISFPLDFIGYRLSSQYGISTQSFSSWMRDELMSFWIGFFIMALLITVLYLLIKKAQKRWWLYAWLLLIPFFTFMMYIQPVLIDPLYNEFTELKNPELEEKILALAHEADIPADRVFEVDMSEKTNAMNAYVNGIGSNLRIVLWDTTLNELDENETLFIMAHEIGHYVMNHLYMNLAGVILSSLVGLYITYRLLHVVINKWGREFGIKSVSEITSLPVLFLLLSLLSIVSAPAESAVSRQAERAADKYAIEMMPDREAAIGSFQELTINGRSEVNPPALVKFFRYGHPTMMERIVMLEEHESEE
ncbi:M48 family metallopeptidase [Halobacillus sp. A5]|uniref:M48 family metallopeptidase n=1 Tax=Halobacillus sp. A5 TaxID=2880263 RepID=UPI0020A651DF|nr:M48 family metallopeptidase [Halobacillus sp. A5]MCP3027245.1 M48 family metallopeptidase [Halobacillus sp. A5]